MFPYAELQHIDLKVSSQYFTKYGQIKNVIILSVYSFNINNFCIHKAYLAEYNIPKITNKVHAQTV